MTEDHKKKLLATSALGIYSYMILNDQVIKKYFPENPMEFIGNYSQVVVGASDSTSAISFGFFGNK